MITGLYPFEGENVYELYDSIGKAEFVVPEIVKQNPILEDLIKAMLHKDPDVRLGTYHVLHHP